MWILETLCGNRLLVFLHFADNPACYYRIMELATGVNQICCMLDDVNVINTSIHMLIRTEFSLATGGA